MMKGLPALHSAWTIIPRFPLGGGHVAKDVTIWWFTGARNKPIAPYAKLITGINDVGALIGLMYERYDDEVPRQKKGDPVDPVIEEKVDQARWRARCKVDEYFSRGEIKSLQKYLRDEYGLPLKWKRKNDLPIPCVKLRDDGTLRDQYAWASIDANYTKRDALIALSLHSGYNLPFYVWGRGVPYTGKAAELGEPKDTFKEYPLGRCVYYQTPPYSGLKQNPFGKT